MKQFDYNKYLKNNPLLKESIDDEEGSGYSYEYKEGPGASAQELARTIKQFQSDKFTWEKLAKNDFYAMAQGQAADIKSDYYPDWKKSDFEQVINAIEGGSRTRQMTGDPDADWMGETKQSSSNLTDVASDLYRKMLKAGDTFDIDDDAVDVRMEKIAKKRFTSAEFPEFDKLNDDQLQAIIPFLQAVIKAKHFSMFDTWNGTKIVDREN